MQLLISKLREQILALSVLVIMTTGLLAKEFL